MTKKQAAWFFLGATGVFGAVFVGMTLHSHTQFDDLTHAENINEDVLAGKEVWHHQNCVNCHTLMGEGAYFAPDLTKITQLRGEAYLTQFMVDPSRFYSEIEDGRLMPTLDLPDTEIRQVIAFLEWIGHIENSNWPPRPILVSGGALPGSYGTGEPVNPSSNDPVELGEYLFRSTNPGCFACHSTSPGVTLVGPSVAGLGARAQEILGSEGYAGSATTIEAYIRESILEPSAHLVEGPGTFAVNGQSVMPPNYDQTLSAGEIDQLVAYLSSLR
jgi:nitric oxide reductase subunit C